MTSCLHSVLILSVAMMQANMNMQKYAKNSKGQKKFVFFLAIKKLFPRPAKPSEGRALYIYHYLLHHLLAINDIQALAHSVDVVAHDAAVDRVDAHLLGCSRTCSELVDTGRYREVVVALLQ